MTRVTLIEVERTAAMIHSERPGELVVQLPGSDRLHTLAFNVHSIIQLRIVDEKRPTRAIRRLERLWEARYVKNDGSEFWCQFKTFGSTGFSISCPEHEA